MQNDLLAKMRNSRTSRSVLKLKLVNLRGRSPNIPLLIFEGDEDKIVYNRWLGRVTPNLNYEAFVCRGKSTVAVVQDIVRQDLGSLASKTFFLIDRDFDDTRSFVNDDTLFVTDRYSVENYLVDPVVLGSIVRDEFPCHEHPDLNSAIVRQFEDDYSAFLELTRPHNERLFLYIRLNIPLPNGLPDKISDFAHIDISNVRASNVSVGDMIPEISAAIKADDDHIRSEFNELNQRNRYRGKNAYMFFQKWLGLLCDHFDKKSGPFHGSEINGRIRRNELTIGTLAAKSPLPEGFGTFASRMAA